MKKSNVDELTDIAGKLEGVAQALKLEGWQCDTHAALLLMLADVVDDQSCRIADILDRANWKE